MENLNDWAPFVEWSNLSLVEKENSTIIKTKEPPYSIFVKQVRVRYTDGDLPEIQEIYLEQKQKAEKEAQEQKSRPNSPTVPWHPNLIPPYVPPNPISPRDVTVVMYGASPPPREYPTPTITTTRGGIFIVDAETGERKFVATPEVDLSGVEKKE